MIGVLFALLGFAVVAAALIREWRTQRQFTAGAVRELRGQLLQRDIRIRELETELRGREYMLEREIRMHLNALGKIALLEKRGGPYRCP